MKNTILEKALLPSTKLVRWCKYLKNGELSLVIGIKERHYVKNAPHLVETELYHPNIRLRIPLYGIGLKIYDLMAGKLGLGPSQMLSKTETIEKIPNVNQKELRRNYLHDGQFDDADGDKSCSYIEENGGTVINY